MNEKSYCYRKLWKKPITIHKIGKGEHALIFSRGLELRQILVAALILLILFIFHKLLNLFIPKAFMLALYIGIPWLLSGKIVKSNVDGKRIDRYILGSILHFYRRKTIYSSFESVHKSEMEKYVYEKFKR